MAFFLQGTGALFKSIVKTNTILNAICCFYIEMRRKSQAQIRSGSFYHLVFLKDLL